MHQTRRSSSTKLPIERKGTKYIARARSHVSSSVPVVIAVRDMLKLAKTAKEVRNMIKGKLLKINGRIVEDYRESIQLFNILEADKAYELSILPTKKFFFQPAQSKDERLCKVIKKRLVKKGVTQINLHDGTNILTKDKINTGDSVYLGFDSKIKKAVHLAKDKNVFIFKGKYSGQNGKIVDKEGRIIEVSLNGGAAKLQENCLIAL